MVWYPLKGTIVQTTETTLHATSWKQNELVGIRRIILVDQWKERDFSMREILGSILGCNLYSFSFLWFSGETFIVDLKIMSWKCIDRLLSLSTDLSLVVVLIAIKFCFLDFSSKVAVEFPAITKVDRIRYSGTLPSLQAFTLCYWIKIVFMESLSSAVSYANSETHNALLIGMKKNKAMIIYLNSAELLVKNC